MADSIIEWTGIETDALQETMGLRVEDFAAAVRVTPRMVYRWRHAGPEANIRDGNQYRLAELHRKLTPEQQERFQAALAAKLAQWRGPSGLMVTSSLSPTVLTGHWITTFVFGEEQRCHADIGEISMRADQVITATNYPPEPRSEMRRAGFRHHIEATLVDRQLIGQWRNSGDNYYVGTLHLAVLPGETVLDGVYTGNAHNGQIVSQHWKWVRLDPASLENFDLNDITLQDPQLIYALVGKHRYADGPLTLNDVAEAL